MRQHFVFTSILAKENVYHQALPVENCEQLAQIMTAMLTIAVIGETGLCYLRIFAVYRPYPICLGVLCSDLPLCGGHVLYIVQNIWSTENQPNAILPRNRPGGLRHSHPHRTVCQRLFDLYRHRLPNIQRLSNLRLQLYFQEEMCYHSLRCLLADRTQIYPPRKSAVLLVRLFTYF